MEKKVSSTGMYETTYSGDVFVGKLSTTTKIGLTDQTKVALLEYLTESDDFHKLVCDITGTERNQVKASQELEKLKEDYSYLCDRYKKEQQESDYLLDKWRKEKVRRLAAEKERDNAEKHHKFIVDKTSSILKEVGCKSIGDLIDELKAERAKGELLAEQYELSINENDKLAKLLREIEGRYDRIAKGYDNACKEAKTAENIRKNLSANYDRLAEDYNYLNTLYNNQKEYIAQYIEENKQLTDKVEKLKGKLDRNVYQ
nr:MAG TPA: hypothetical protein [Caudoviricetes sp.]